MKQVSLWSLSHDDGAEAVGPDDRIHGSWLILTLPSGHLTLINRQRIRARTRGIVMLIGILQTGDVPSSFRAETGDYPAIFEKMLSGRGLTFKAFAVLRDEFPPGVNSCEGWLITGSPSSAYDADPWIARLKEFIRAAYEARIPVVGICFGHQVIAEAMGGKVEKYPGGWSIGATEYAFDGQPLTLNAWHRDQVIRKPDMARVIASNAFCKNAALLYDGPILSIQPHPELDGNFISHLIDEAVHESVPIPDDLIATARANLDAETDSTQIADRIAQFFKDNQSRR